MSEQDLNSVIASENHDAHWREKLQAERDALLEQNKALKERLEGLDLIEQSIVRQNESQHRLEAERDRYRTALTDIRDSAIVGIPNEIAYKAIWRICVEIAKSALAQEQK